MNRYSKTAINPILIVDRDGFLGDKLSEKLVEDFVVVYVSANKQSFKSENLIFSHYGKNIPVIPNGKYSYIFAVDSGIWTKGYLSEFIKKAKENNSELLFLVSLFNLDSFYKSFKKTKAKSDLVKVQGGAKIIIFGEIFNRSRLLPFLKMAIKNETIHISGDGLSKTYPVFLDDAVSGIINAVSEPNASYSVFYIFPKYPPTQISLARMVQKSNPSIGIDFVKLRGHGLVEARSAERHQDQILKPFGLAQGGRVQDDKGGGKYILSDNYSLEKRINEIKIDDFNVAKKSNAIDDGFTYKKQKRFASTPSLLASLRSGSNGLIFLLFLILMPAIATFTFSFLGYVNLGSAKGAVEKGNLADAKRSVDFSNTFFNLADGSSGVLLEEAKIIGQEKQVVPIVKKINIGQSLALAASDGLDASDIILQVFTGESKKPKEDFEKGKGLLKSAVVHFRELSIENKIPDGIAKEIKSTEGVVEILENTIDILPDILGFDGKKTYLVLFQNNMELRPGGGFIGSYGLLTIDSGQVKDFTIHDVYDADGQLKEHVEPPYPIRRYLALPHWYLRDSNFDIDFEKSAGTAALLLNKESGIETDGVVGLDVTFVKNILETIGEIYVSDYRETVNAGNLYEITQAHAEKNSFPGSRQKKNFLRSLFDSMRLSLGVKENIPYLALVKNIRSSISEKHLLFASSNSYIQDIFSANGWSSVLQETPFSSSILGDTSTKGESVKDFLGINEANLGVNKANFFVKRNLFHNVEIGNDGSISETVRIQYENASSGWPGGDYVNYLRIILPFNTALSSVSFDGIAQQLIPAVTDFRIYENENFVEPGGLEVERYDQDGKTIYGFLVNVGAGKAKEVEIKYSLSEKFSPDSKSFSYNLGIFKQPGTEEYPYSFSIRTPENLKVINGKSSFSTSLLGDLEYEVNIFKR